MGTRGRARVRVCAPVCWTAGHSTQRTPNVQLPEAEGPTASEPQKRRVSCHRCHVVRERRPGRLDAIRLEWPRECDRRETGQGDEPGPAVSSWASDCILARGMWAGVAPAKPLPHPPELPSPCMATLEASCPRWCGSEWRRTTQPTPDCATSGLTEPAEMFRFICSRAYLPHGRQPPGALPARPHPSSDLCLVCPHSGTALGLRLNKACKILALEATDFPTLQSSEFLDTSPCLLSFPRANGAFLLEPVSFLSCRVTTNGSHGIPPASHGSPPFQPPLLGVAASALPLSQHHVVSGFGFICYHNITWPILTPTELGCLREGAAFTKTLRSINTHRTSRGTTVSFAALVIGLSLTGRGQLVPAQGHRHCQQILAALGRTQPHLTPLLLQMVGLGVLS